MTFFFSTKCHKKTKFRFQSLIMNPIRYLIAYKNLLRAIENIGIAVVYGIRYQSILGHIAEIMRNFVNIWPQKRTVITDFVLAEHLKLSYIGHSWCWRRWHSSRVYNFWANDLILILKTPYLSVFVSSLFFIQNWSERATHKL